MAFGLKQSYYGDQQTGLAGLGSGNQWIDPRTGQLMKQPDPSRPGEVEAAQAALSKHADDLAMKNWREQMTYLDKTAGAGQINPEPIINQGTEEISESQRADTRGLRRALAASGGAGARGGAGEMAGLASLGTKYAGMRQNLARDTRIQTDAFNASNRDRERSMKMDLMRQKPVPTSQGLANLGAPGFKFSGGLQQSGSGSGISGEQQNYMRNPNFKPGDNGPSMERFRPGIRRQQSNLF